MKILMVCYGNICRSPIAEGVMKAKLLKYHLSGIVDSAGVISYHSGEAPDARAIQVAKLNNVDIAKQQARQFKKDDFEDFDVILTLDKMVHKAIISLATTTHEKSKVVLLLEYAGSVKQTEVPDPYYGEMDGFNLVYEMIDDACEKIALTIKS